MLMYVYTAEQIRQIDAEAERLGLNQFILMENAGRGLFAKIKQFTEPTQSIGIIAGRGNNGGDGIVLARYLLAMGYNVSLMLPLGAPTSKVAKSHLAYYLSRGYTISNWDAKETFDIVIDALLGIGTRHPLPKKIKHIIGWANKQHAIRIAIDLPTGVLADYGNIETGDLSNDAGGSSNDAGDSSNVAGDSSNVAGDLSNPAVDPSNDAGDAPNSTGEMATFHAHYTFSLHGAKQSAFLYPSSHYYGKLEVVSIGLEQSHSVNGKKTADSQNDIEKTFQTSAEKYPSIKRPVEERDGNRFEHNKKTKHANFENYIKVTSEVEVRNTLPNRRSSGHKGTFGTSLIVAGSDEMPGSVTLSAIGSIRTGTGRLIIGTPKSVIPVVAAHVPEATFIADGLGKIANGEIPEKIAAAAIGPGLVDSERTQQTLEQLMKLSIPIVVDAGALEKRTTWKANGPIIVTPHPGEFSRLTGHDVQTIQQNRIELAREFSKKHHIIVVLKGEYTVIAFPSGRTYINPTGNTGLAKGGSGDVLTGILTSFLATHDNVKNAVVNAVYVHGLCANEWAKTYSEAALTASDFAKLLPQVLKKLEMSE